MKRLLVFLPVLFIGCSSEYGIEINYQETYNYFIPDSNKEKYADFVSKSISGCLKDCDALNWHTKKTGGELYGSRRYMIQEYFGPWYDRKIVTNELAVEEMNERQLEYFKKYH
jgi:hypothetical protein